MDIWKEGKYFDLWSVNHLLSGIIFTGWFLLYGLSIWQVFVLHFIGAVGWEATEHFIGVKEHLRNKVVDVICGNIGLCVGYFFLFGFRALIIWSVIYLIMQVLGYLAYRKRRVQDK